MSCVCSYSWIFTEAIQVKYLRYTLMSHLGFQPSGHKSGLLNIPANWAGGIIHRFNGILRLGLLSVPVIVVIIDTRFSHSV